MNAMNEVVKSWNRNPGLQIASLVVLVASFLLLVSSFLVSKNFFVLLTQWGEASNLSVYIKEGAAAGDVQKVAKHLNAIEGIQKIDFYSKEEAVTDFTERFSHLLPDLVEDPEIQSVLPASFEASLSSELVTGSVQALLKKISSELESFEAVEAVTFGEDWINDYASVLRIVRFVGIAFAFIIFIGTLFITGNSIRSSIYSRQEEIVVMELIGATNSMIRRPFVIEGTILGTMAMAVSLILCFMFYSWVQSYIAEQLAFSGLKGEISFFSIVEVSLLLLTGTLLGALGSYLTAKNLNTGWLASEA